MNQTTLTVVLGDVDIKAYPMEYFTIERMALKWVVWGHGPDDAIVQRFDTFDTLDEAEEAYPHAVTVLPNS